MDGAEARAAGRLAGDALGGFGTLVRDMHSAIATRAFEAIGPGVAPVRAVHDGVSTAVYAAVRGALTALPRAGGAVYAARTAPGAPRLTESPRGSLALAALNAAVGDALGERGDPLALEMALRHHGRELPLEPSPLGEAFPGATPRIALFVHGLGETDLAWRMMRDRGPSYGSRLRSDLGYSPLYLRYNTGLHISENASGLSDLLELLVEAWPVPVDEIVLVGHSMGGLVARGACHRGQADGRRWVEAVRHVMCLGSPHLGAPLEKGANALGWALGRLPETRPFANVVNGRSAGIKDLRYGACVEADWRSCDPDEFLRDRCSEVPFLESASYYFVGATLGDGPIGNALGDLLVRFPSASGSGRKRRIPFEVDNGCRLDGINHFDLLNHPAVYERIGAWLTA
jgi:pimeloyl-ACP methyl ester carboxylesterase